jgi:hypothetical protein
LNQASAGRRADQNGDAVEQARQLGQVDVQHEQAVAKTASGAARGADA